MVETTVLVSDWSRCGGWGQVGDMFRKGGAQPGQALKFKCVFLLVKEAVYFSMKILRPPKLSKCIDKTKIYVNVN